MKNIYLQTNEMEKELIKLGLTQNILMENAANALEKLIRKSLKKGRKILFLLGSGNNAVDAIITARKLQNDYKCFYLLTSQKASPVLQKELEIAKIIGVKEIFEIKKFHLFVDGIFGSGLNRKLENHVEEILQIVNSKRGLKIAIDIPSGVDKFGNIQTLAFKADFTLAIGAKKLALYMDNSKDFVGKIKQANLGVSSKSFESKTEIFLLQNSDMNLPFRRQKTVNKGDFGHTFVISGQNKGASILCAKAAFNIGSGLVSIYSKQPFICSEEIMIKDSFKDAKTVVIGSGFGNENIDFSLLYNKKVLIDADMCYKKETIEIIQNNKDTILTPHPKEFSSLLKLGGFGEFSVKEIQKNRFELVRNWSLKFNSILLLKGANSLIAKNGVVYVMDKGSNILAKGGSGDVLSGIVGGLLAQDYDCLRAAICGSLIHAKAAKMARVNSYALSPNDIINSLKTLK